MDYIVLTQSLYSFSLPIRDHVGHQLQLFVSVVPVSFLLYSIQLFRERLSEKKRTRQSRNVIWDMVSTLFLTL